RELVFVVVGVLAFAGAVTFVDGVVLLFGPSSLMLIFHPAIAALHVVLIAVAFWPGMSRMRFRHYAIIATVAAAAFWILYAAQGWTYYYRTGYMLLATSILYV